MSRRLKSLSFLIETVWKATKTTLINLPEWQRGLWLASLELSLPSR